MHCTYISISSRKIFEVDINLCACCVCAVLLVALPIVNPGCWSCVMPLHDLGYQVQPSDVH